MLSAGSESSNIAFQWNDNLVLLYRDKLTRGWQLWSAQQVVPKSAIARIVDTVRTRVLNMALEIRAEIGDKDADLEKITAEESKKVDQTIVNNIFGGNVYVSTGQATMNATSNSRTSLLAIGSIWRKCSEARAYRNLNSLSFPRQSRQTGRPWARR